MLAMSVSLRVQADACMMRNAMDAFMETGIFIVVVLAFAIGGAVDARNYGVAAGLFCLFVFVLCLIAIVFCKIITVPRG